MSQKTKQGLKQTNNQNFPNNNSAFITPEKLRNFNDDIIDSVALDVDTQLSGSVTLEGSLSASGDISGSSFYGDGSGLTGIVSEVPAGTVSGSSQVILTDTTGNLGGNRITGSVTNAVSASHSETTDLAYTANYADSVPFSGVLSKPTLVSGSSQISYNGITDVPVGIVSSSAQVSDLTASLIDDATIVDATITFTNGDGSTFDITVDNVVNSTYSQNTITTGKNLHSLEIPKGTPLYFTGSGTSGNLVGIYPADAGNPNRMPAGGVAGEDIAVGAEGVVLLDGFINGVDTTLFQAGDEVFVAVGGGYTNIAPTGSANLIQHLGNVEKSAVNGSGVIQMMGEARGLPNIQSGYVWVGDGDGVPQAVSTSSLQTDTSDLVTTSSFNQYTASNDSKVNSLISETSSYARTDTDNNFSGTQTFNNITVNGTGSFAYIESVTGSAKIIGDAFIILNNDTPTERYAGIAVQDSGSAGVTASFQFDGQENNWFYEYSNDGGVTTDHGIALFGPEYSDISNPTYLTNNRLPKSDGGHHLVDSNISDNGSVIQFESPVSSSNGITSSLAIEGNQRVKLAGNGIGQPVGAISFYSSSDYNPTIGYFNMQPQPGGH